jgi:hypothetical protein
VHHSKMYIMKNFIFITVAVLYCNSSRAQDSIKVIEAPIQQVIPQGRFSAIVITKGSEHGLKNDDKGKLSDSLGTEVTITEVFPMRARAIAKTTANNIDPAKSKVIFKVAQ